MANKDTGIVNIHGKEYQTVAYRVGKFRETHGLDLSLTTEIVSRDSDCVVMRATIASETGRVLATGHSEEYRASSTINKTSALENAETSAIGRALAALGLGGTEFASADEVARAVSGSKGTYQSVAKDAWDEQDAESQKFLQGIADQVRSIGEGEGWIAAMRHLEEQKLDPDEKVALWSRFDSKERAAMEPHKRKKAA
jgi:hypothetical protein